MKSAQNLYKPVPQYLSDSDSEKELDLNDSNISKPKTEDVCYKQPLRNGVHVKIFRKHKNEMSVPRKIVFVVSLLACFGTILVFLFVIPCDGNGACPVRISNWEVKHEGFELKGSINVVKDVLNYSTNLALLFTHNVLHINSRNGVIGLFGSNGLIAWYTERTNGPIDMNCYLIDVNIDGTTDCLLVKSVGIEVIDPISGEIFWSVLYENRAPTSFPIVLPDLNFDGVKEVVITNGNKLLLINGATGIVLCKYIFEQCMNLNLNELYLDNIMCACVQKSGVIYFKILITEFTMLMRNSTYEIRGIESDYSLPKKEPYIVSDHKLIINSTGSCTNCETNVSLRNMRIGLDVFSKRFPKTYIMQPSYFAFEKTAKNIALLENHLNGFILKLWQWSDERETSTTEFISTLNVTVQINFIKERIILITFNSTNVQVINASVTEIIQLCIPAEDGEFTCQPDKSNQDKSLLITDIDNDGKLELISYSSTFVPQVTGGMKHWELVSNVRVFHLETELPKFYRMH